MVKQRNMTNKSYFALAEQPSKSCVNKNKNALSLCRGQRSKHKSSKILMVGEEGLEPSRLLRPADFKSAAYTNSATRPRRSSHGCQRLLFWRRLPELNRCKRFCRPLRNHSAKAPSQVLYRTLPDKMSQKFCSLSARPLAKLSRLGQARIS